MHPFHGKWWKKARESQSVNVDILFCQQFSLLRSIKIFIFVKVLSISNIAYISVQYLFFWESFTTTYIILFTTTSLLAWLAYYFMKNMSKPELDESGKIVGPGSDLNMQGHISEYFKDAILFSVIVHALSLLSNYMWFLLLVVPCYLFVLLWKNFLGPWFFAPAPEEDPNQDPNQKGKKEKRKIVRVK